MKRLLLLLLLASPALAQPARRIPDAALRRVLARQGFLTNGVLNEKSRGWVQLYIAGADIKSLEGIQYFTNVEWLTIRDTGLTALTHLPPRLKYLNCPHNVLLTLPKLPPGLVSLSCNDNRLTQLPPLPAALTELNCSNNRLTRLPALPATLVQLNSANNRLTALPPLPRTLQYLNYWHNPALGRTLAPVFQTMSCPDPEQNCLPNTLRRWNILQAKIGDTTSTFSGLKVMINAEHSWGFGSTEETIHFRQAGGQLVADSVQMHKRVPDHGHGPVDSTYFRRAAYTVSQSFIRQVVKDIYAQKLVFDFGMESSEQHLDLTTKRLEHSQSSCRDCSSFSITYVLYSRADSIKLSYFVYSMLGAGPLAEAATPPLQTALLDWLYMYKLTQATVPDHETVRFFFRPHYLRQILKWAQ